MEPSRLMALLAQSPESMSFQDLWLLRGATSDDPLMQEILSPLEHRAFAREFTRENPLNALGLLAAVPGYQVAKMVGRAGAPRTAPSMQQFWGGLQGIAQGLRRQ